MKHVYDQLLDLHGGALLIGADVPQVTALDLTAAVDALENAASPWAIGPSEDGGFWLVGGRAPIPSVAWRDTPWSRPDTLARFCAALSPPPMRLRTLRDIDTAADLSALRLDSGRVAGSAAGATPTSGRIAWQFRHCDALAKPDANTIADAALEVANPSRATPLATCP